MPTLSMFYGILIRMYSGQREHRPPHVHVLYGDETAVFDILGAELLEGSVPPRQRKMIEAWIEIHREELLADWALAQAGEELFKIEPLR